MALIREIPTAHATLDHSAIPGVEAGKLQPLNTQVSDVTPGGGGGWQLGHTFTLPAGQLAANGDQVILESYAIIGNDNPNLGGLRFVLAGTSLQPEATSVTVEETYLRVIITRRTATTGWVSVEVMGSVTQVVQVTEVTKTWSGTQVLTFEGNQSAGSPTTLKYMRTSYLPA